jgi:hypothetical protein
MPQADDIQEALDGLNEALDDDFKSEEPAQAGQQAESSEPTQGDQQSTEQAGSQAEPEKEARGKREIPSDKETGKEADKEEKQASPGDKASVSTLSFMEKHPKFANFINKHPKIGFALVALVNIACIGVDSGAWLLGRLATKFAFGSESAYLSVLKRHADAEEIASNTTETTDHETEEGKKTKETGERKQTEPTATKEQTQQTETTSKLSIQEQREKVASIVAKFGYELHEGGEYPGQTTDTVLLVAPGNPMKSVSMKLGDLSSFNAFSLASALNALDGAHSFANAHDLDVHNLEMAAKAVTICQAARMMLEGASAFEANETLSRCEILTQNGRTEISAQISPYEDVELKYDGLEMTTYYTPVITDYFPEAVDKMVREFHDKEITRSLESIRDLERTRTFTIGGNGDVKVSFAIDTNNQLAVALVNGDTRTELGQFDVRTEQDVKAIADAMYQNGWDPQKTKPAGQWLNSRVVAYTMACIANPAMAQEQAQDGTYQNPFNPRKPLQAGDAHMKVALTQDGITIHQVLPNGNGDGMTLGKSYTFNFADASGDLTKVATFVKEASSEIAKNPPTPSFVDTRASVVKTVELGAMYDAMRVDTAAQPDLKHEQEAEEDEKRRRDPVSDEQEIERINKITAQFGYAVKRDTQEAKDAFVTITSLSNPQASATMRLSDLTSSNAYPLACAITQLEKSGNYDLRVHNAIMATKAVAMCQATRIELEGNHFAPGSTIASCPLMFASGIVTTISANTVMSGENGNKPAIQINYDDKKLAAYPSTSSIASMASDFASVYTDQSSYMERKIRECVVAETAQTEAAQRQETCAPLYDEAQQSGANMPTEDTETETTQQGDDAAQQPVENQAAEQEQTSDVESGETPTDEAPTYDEDDLEH